MSDALRQQMRSSRSYNYIPQHAHAHAQATVPTTRIHSKLGGNQTPRKPSPMTPGHGAQSSPWNTAISVDTAFSLDDSDSDYTEESEHKHAGTRPSQSTASHSSGIDTEWVQCKESDTGRTIWYNRETLMVTFENPLLDAEQRIRHGSILKESIHREDIEDSLIPRFLLRFASQRWDFKNDLVDVFRAQCARIDHTKLLPHPNDLVFPEFFSNHTIPRKDSFVATILPPSDLKIPTAHWKMSITVNETTASDIIKKFVAKINLTKKDHTYHPQHFVMKVIGNEEYILFDDNKLIIDYEAVRRAVRNEDDVSFGLVHRPDIQQIIADAQELQEEYKAKFASKYNERARDPFFLIYEHYGCGDGKSVLELGIEEDYLEEKKQREDEHKQKQPHMSGTGWSSTTRSQTGSSNATTALSTTYAYSTGFPSTSPSHAPSFSDSFAFGGGHGGGGASGQAPPSPRLIQESTTNHVGAPVLSPKNHHQHQFSPKKRPPPPSPRKKQAPPLRRPSSLSNALPLPHLTAFTQSAPIYGNQMHMNMNHNHNNMHMQNMNMQGQMNGNMNMNMNMNQQMQNPQMNMNMNPQMQNPQMQMPMQAQHQTPQMIPMNPPLHQQQSAPMMTLATAGGLQQRDVSPLHVNGQSTVLGPTGFNHAPPNGMPPNAWQQMNQNFHQGHMQNPHALMQNMNNMNMGSSMNMNVQNMQNMNMQSQMNMNQMNHQHHNGGSAPTSPVMQNNFGGNRGGGGGGGNPFNIPVTVNMTPQNFNSTPQNFPDHHNHNHQAATHYNHNHNHMHQLAHSAGFEDFEPPTSPHRASMTETRQFKRVSSNSSAAVSASHKKRGRSSTAAVSSSNNHSSTSPFGREPSLRDSEWLRNEIRHMNQSRTHTSILLEDHHQPVQIKISGLTNVTKLPRFVDMASQIRRVVVVHELWMGPLSFSACKYSTPNIARVSDNMKFADWYTAKDFKYCDLPREASISCTIYGLSQHEKNKNEVVRTPLGFVRLPIVDHRHRLINGRYVLNVWPIAVFVKTKHGLKSDPYSHGEEFRFRGAIRDRYIGRGSHNEDANPKEDDAHASSANGKKKKHSTGNLSAKKVKNKPSSILDHFDKLSHDICQITIEFTRRDFDVVAPLISLQEIEETERKAKAKWNLKSESNDGGKTHGKHSKKEKKTSKKDKDKDRATTDKREEDEDGLSGEDWKHIHHILTRDMIAEIDAAEKDMIWKAREQLVQMPAALPVFLKCVDWRCKFFRAEAYESLKAWQPPTHLEDALELLGYEFMDTRVREYGVMCIASMHDSDLQRYLLQLVQCLKFELHHNNALIRLLMRRALMNPYQIGHFLFWHLKSEYHNLEVCERFGLYMEEYLLHSTTHARELLQQSNLMDALQYINRVIYVGKNGKDKKDSSVLKNELHDMIEQLNQQMPEIISLPLNPRWRCTHLVVEKCRYFGSAQVPLYLVFKNVDPLADDIHVLFKTGDDLRQDILTLQVFRVMDKVWLDRGLNLRLITYDVVATGSDCGMLQIVLNANTTNDIHVTEGGGPQKGCRDETTHYKWLRKHNPNQQHLDNARYNYARSVAGYCVATYVLGIGDRHPDNIMLRENGVLFHIDFGHFLGNFKVKKVVANYTYRRERTPFVFLPAMKYVMDVGGKDGQTYADFQQWFEDAYMALRIRHRLLFNLFTLMIPSVMPELICKEDLGYLKEQLHLSDIAQDKIGKHCKKVIKMCLNDKSRILDNIFHAVKHA